MLALTGSPTTIATAAREDLVSPDVPTVILVAVVLGLAAVRFIVLQGRTGKRFFALKALATGGLLYALVQVVARGVSLVTPWPLLALVVAGALAVECAVGAYRWERTTIGVGRGRTVLALRIFAILLVVTVLLEPVLTRIVERRIDREIVVLVDDSESMGLSDDRSSPAERLRLAQFYTDPAVAERADVREQTRELAALARQTRELAGGLGDGSLLAEAAAASVTDNVAATRDALGEIVGSLDTTRVGGDPDGKIDSIARSLREQVVPKLDQAIEAVAAEKGGDAVSRLNESAEALAELGTRLVEASMELDIAVYSRLDADAKARVDALADKSRAEIARDLLESTAIKEALGERYTLREARFARSTTEVGGTPESVDGGEGQESPGDADPSAAVSLAEIEEGEYASTNVAAALEAAAESIAPETLAGVVLISDGRHNARDQVEDVARRLGIQGAPVGAIALGSSVGPPDASVIELQVPESIYLGDRILARASLKLDGLRGKTVKAGLYLGDEKIDEQDIAVPEDQFTATVRFRDAPEDKGTRSYSVRIDPVEGERFSENNAWFFDVAVTDDRKNVLIVDSVPRWEFRYLRNLFFARDKSVHLQYVLLNREDVAGAQDLADIPASASRPFGEAEATRLPESREEWLKFDAIILGDVPPAVFGANEWEMIDACVRERGAMLVLIAGPNAMPHAFSDDLFRALCPVVYDADPGAFVAGEPADGTDGFRLTLTAEGRGNSIMRQAPSGVVNSQIWADMPPLYWRHPVTTTKEGAEVLAYAEPLGGSSLTEVAFRGLTEQRDAERKNPLVAVHRYALGSVCMLMTDRTWRFRHTVGDTYHHRFWGQLLRWGTGENLREGNEFVRLGTDRISYTPGEPVKVIARIADTDYKPITDGEVQASVFRDGERIVRKTLTYRQGSNGIYEAEVGPFPGSADRYRVVLEGSDSARILGEGGIEELATTFSVDSAKNPIELSELTVNRELLSTIADLSGGRVLDAAGADQLASLFGEPSKVVEEIQETTLWDKWPILALFLIAVTAEWLVRRRAGLV